MDRRRQRAGIAVALVLAAAVAAVLLRSRDDGPRVPVQAIRRPAARVLSRAPYMGVACRVPNSLACDRLGLAVWLRRPARAVHASIYTRDFALTTYVDGRRGARLPRRSFAGYLAHAGLRTSFGLAGLPQANWTGSPEAHTPWVLLRVHYGPHQPDVLTQVRVRLSPGYG